LRFYIQFSNLGQFIFRSMQASIFFVNGDLATFETEKFPTKLSSKPAVPLANRQVQFRKVKKGK